MKAADIAKFILFAILLFALYQAMILVLHDLSSFRLYSDSFYGIDPEYSDADRVYDALPVILIHTMVHLIGAAILAVIFSLFHRGFALSIIVVIPLTVFYIINEIAIGKGMGVHWLIPIVGVLSAINQVLYLPLFVYIFKKIGLVQSRFPSE